MDYITENSLNSISTAQNVATLMALMQQEQSSANGHAERVTAYSKLIAGQLGVKEDEIRHILSAAMMHDLGKITITSATINRLGRMSAKEIEMMQLRAELAMNVCLNQFQKNDVLSPIVPIIRHLNCRYDGKGDSGTVSGANIPLGSRIIAVAEAYDILRSGTPWVSKRTCGEALAELKKDAGVHFDPRVVEALCKLENATVN